MIVNSGPLMLRSISSVIGVALGQIHCKHLCFNVTEQERLVCQAEDDHRTLAVAPAVNFEALDCIDTGLLVLVQGFQAGPVTATAAVDTIGKACSGNAAGLDTRKRPQICGAITEELQKTRHCSWCSCRTSGTY